MIELLRLTAPEIVVALAGLLVLILDLAFLRRQTGSRQRAPALKELLHRRADAVADRDFSPRLRRHPAMGR